jgi:hypothetical protein
MVWRAMSELHIERQDGTFVDLQVDRLSEEDVNWLEAARRNSAAMKTEQVDADHIPVSEDGEKGQLNSEANESQVDLAPQ